MSYDPSIPKRHIETEQLLTRCLPVRTLALAAIQYVLDLLAHPTRGDAQSRKTLYLQGKTVSCRAE